MAWNRGGYNRDGGGGRGGYDAGNWRGKFDGPAKKKSGCAMKTLSDGRICVYGWRKDEHGGLMKFVATESHRHPGLQESKRGGRPFVLLVAKVTWGNGMQQLHNIAWRPEERKGSFPGLGLVCSVGGNYFGHVSRRGR